MYILKYYEPHKTGKLYLLADDVIHDSLVLNKQQLQDCLRFKIKSFDIAKCVSLDMEFRAAQSMVKYFIIKYEIANKLLPDSSKWQQSGLV
jgi:hypothetical protein